MLWLDAAICFRSTEVMIFSGTRDMLLYVQKEYLLIVH